MTDKLHNYTIYKLHHSTDTEKDFYVGSTRQSISLRESKHKSNCNNTKCKSYNYGVYCYIREHGGFHNWKLSVLEACDSISKLRAREIEKMYMIDLGAKLNTYTPMRTQDEINQYIKEKNKCYQSLNRDYFKKYRIDNNAKINAKYNCACTGMYTHVNKSKHFQSAKHIRFLKTQPQQ